MEQPPNIGLGYTIERLGDAEMRDLWQKATAKIVTEPDTAITAARAMVERVFGFVLETRGDDPADKNKFEKGLKYLGLQPGDLVDQTARLVGTLRHKSGIAHPKEKGLERVQAKDARFAVCLAGGVTAFILETLEEAPYWDVVFVCSGATCRSPMAAAIFVELWGDSTRQLNVAASGIRLESRGVREEAKKAVPASTSIRRVQASRATLSCSRLLITMEPRQKDSCRELDDIDSVRVVLLGELAGRGQKGVPDPVNELTGDPAHDDQVYRNTANLLKEWLKDAMPNIKAKLQAKPGSQCAASASARSEHEIAVHPKLDRTGGLTNEG